MSTPPKPGSPATPAMNATAMWLAGEIARNGLHEYLCRALNNSLSLSRECRGEVEDHVNNAYAAWIRRDAFAHHLAAGKVPRRRNLVAWAKQVSANTLRDRGTDAVHRELRGARTEHEREVFTESENGMAPWAAHAPKSFALVCGQHEDMAEGEVEGDIVDLDAVDAEELLARSELVETVEEVFRRSCTRSKDAADRLNKTFRLLSEEVGSLALAAELGVTKLRAEKVAQATRDRLRESESRVREALMVMRAVGDEPHMTHAEVQESLDGLTDLPATVKELVARGYLSEHKGGTLRLTASGHNRLTKQGGWHDRLLL